MNDIAKNDEFFKQTSAVCLQSEEQNIAWM